MKRMLSILLALALVPFALAHTGTDPKGDKSIPGPNPSCWPTQNPHDYTFAATVAYNVIGQKASFGRTVNWDGNMEDCDGDGTPGETDTDFEWGNGGGFFPAGPWASLCGYVPHHSGDVHVHDAFFQSGDGTGLHEVVNFAVGADPSPPTLVPVTDPTTGQTGNQCVMDGCICPKLDPDDWLKDCLHKCDLSPPADNKNPFFGQPGGDGGYWVLVNCNVSTDGGWEGTLVTVVDENGDGIHDDVVIADVNPPTTMGVTCSLTGHIYFPNVWPGKFR